MKRHVGVSIAAVLLAACALAIHARRGSQTKAATQSPETQGTDLTFLLYSYPNNSKQELLAIDPSGKSIGKDALTGKEYKSAENAVYSVEGQGDLDNISTPVVKSIRFVNPVTGSYRVRITTKTSGHFDLYVTGNCEKEVGRRQVRRKHLAAGIAQTYSVRFDANDCGKLTLTPSTRTLSNSAAQQ